MLHIIESNAVQTLLVSFAGVVAYGAYRCRPWLVAFVGFIVAGLLAFSFLFDVGEVYSYSDFYKRAYWFFGDDVTTCLTAVYIWSLLSRRPKLGCAVATAILLSGGRIGNIDDNSNWLVVFQAEFELSRALYNSLGNNRGGRLIVLFFRFDFSDYDLGGERGCVSTW
ncbi:hypothetical protein HFN80_35985 [Rhizobium laguerreae]|uniref:hypothetical protein n=1 Tax=Rhizobium laguerreae TaxID=1076926 RepID=UPI001C91AD66|nr:hypothetical protein [Rhizobium laguerreae]MBY3469295.1 hypothetical protein [Rhizobium laguerreae]